ncbi:mitochondrial intermembrane space translocase subunit [Grosmannia clavigera kw1407]|uniref:Mitochondrial import inner membrane translocase subunit n=1 Tax=Grosmannia clavigera (strain kw1407 / UAMH 11150) TaxID=655863 RepID=F0XQ72_GROCL|nr:mitochondrial intermembrane space translocase subunit [Grosmannia clavigera kw1407]EFX00173.1 mitochondrial intermembrane space translocase subunit [Grosmannia clavigera kw1407]
MFFSSKPKEQAGSPDSLPASATAPVAPVAPGNMDSDAVKKAIIQQVLVESNTSNARQLIDNMNQHCFDSCIPKPGPSISGSEQTCVSQCMEKYITAWNHVNTTLMRRIQQEVANGSI